jgi:hypothetical protein
MRNRTEKTTLVEFRAVLSDFRELTGLAVKGTIAIPVLNLIARVSPPPSNAISFITSGTVFLAVMWTFQFWRSIQESRLKSRMRFAAAFFCASALACGTFLDLFTVRPVSGRDRVVIGYRVRSDVASIVGPSYTPRDALEEAEYDPYKIWTTGSIVAVQLMLVILWLLAFASIGTFVSAFAILQRRKRRHA